MAHNLFNERFFSHRQKAWHGLGQVMDTPHTASEAFEIVGAYDVMLEACYTASGIDTEHNAIVRTATADDPQPRVFGIVSGEYQLVTPRMAVETWDRSVGKTVETLGSLGYGETLFVTTHLPTIDVRGDEVEMYLLLASPMTGKGAIQMRVTPVRVVCQNTLMLAKQQSTEAYRITHDKHAQQRMAEWLHHIYQSALDKTAAITGTFERLASTKATPQAVDNVLELTYSMPRLPAKNCPEAVYAEREQRYEQHAQRATERREAARELFNGKGVGLDSKAAKGTLWGLYNSVAELENYAGRTTDAGRAESTLFGERGNKIETAYEACVAQLPSARK